MDMSGPSGKISCPLFWGNCYTWQQCVLSTWKAFSLTSMFPDKSWMVEKAKNLTFKVREQFSDFSSHKLPLCLIVVYNGLKTVFVHNGALSIAWSQVYKHSCYSEFWSLWVTEHATIATLKAQLWVTDLRNNRKKNELEKGIRESLN